MQTEKTLILVKPDAVQRGLIAEMLGRFERTGMCVAAAKLLHADRSLAERHYKEHSGKPFYEELIAFLTEAPVLAVVLRGIGAIERCRSIRGITDPAKASPGTICGDYAHFLYRGRNLVHASADKEAATREIGMWFSEAEIFDYDRYDHAATMGGV